MKLLINRHAGGQAIVMVVILLAILGGGYWWLGNSARTSEKEARLFAREVVTRMAIQFDRKFVDGHFSSEAQTQFPPSFRERMMYNLHQLGVPSDDFKVDGTVSFRSRFFDPRGQFRAHLKYPNRSADLDFAVSQPHGWWQIDNLNLTYDLPPAAPPAASEASVAPAVPPSPAATP